MEAEAEGRAPRGVAARVLAKQERLIGWQIASERAGAAVKLLTCLTGVAVLVFAAALVWQATQADDVVVAPFATPPSMAEKGLTGAVIAGQVLDRVKAMQVETNPARALPNYGGGWGEGARLSIPNTGISIGDIQSTLTGWLGHETHVSGDVFQTPDGRLAITTRVGGAPGTTVTGAPGDLNDLIEKAAEAIYARTQPYFYAIWLGSHQQRGAEAAPILQRLIYSADKTERVWALSTMAADWAGAKTEADQRRYLQAALRIDPKFMPALGYLSGLELRAGNDELSLQERRRIAAGAKLLRRQIRPDLAAEQLAINEAFLGSITGQCQLGVDATRKILAVYSNNSGRVQTVMRGAQHAICLHDLTLARRLRDEGGLNDAALAELEDGRISTGGSLATRERYALEDWPAAADGLASVWADAWSYPQERARYPVALARAGRVAEAQAALALVPSMPGWSPGVVDRFDLLMARAVVADAAGRRSEADALFARAVALGLSLPQAHEAWSRALLGRGDAAGALREAKAAARIAPGFPDGHRAEGRALLALGRHGEAVKAYAAAEKLTPNWGALEIDWGVALAAQGKRADADARWRRALSLDLSSDDRARAQNLLAGRAA